MKVDLVSATSAVRHSCIEGEICDFSTEEAMVYEVVVTFDDEEVAEGGLYCVVLEDASDLTLPPAVVGGSGAFAVREGIGPGFGAIVVGPRVAAGRLTCRSVDKATDPDAPWRAFAR